MKAAHAKSVGAATFKARCLALLDEVAATGEPLVITKRGRPVARVTPVRERSVEDLRGSVRTLGDIVGPILPPWDCER